MIEEVANQVALGELSFELHSKVLAAELALFDLNNINGCLLLSRVSLYILANEVKAMNSGQTPGYVRHMPELDFQRHAVALRDLANQLRLSPTELSGPRTGLEPRRSL